MAADRDKGSPGKAGSRRMRRAAVALGAATTLFCGVGVPNAGAAVTTGADVEAIKQLKHRYFASVDMDNWPQLYHDLAPDVVVDTTGALGPVFRGRAGFVAFDALLLTLLITHHEGYNPQITVSDDGLTATGVWQMNDRLFAPFNIIGVHGHGEYVDTYEKVDGRWVVKSSALTYNSSSIQILPGILDINIPFIDDGTGFPVSSPEDGADPNPDVEAIKQLKHKYFASVDTNNWPQLFGLLTPDVVVDTSGAFGPVFRGRLGFVAFDALLQAVLKTHHEGYNPIITVSDDGLTATGVWQMNDRLFDPFNIIGINGHGEYVDSYVKVGDSWLVDRSALTYHSSTLQILPGILNINIPLFDDGTPWPTPATDAGEQPSEAALAADSDTAQRTVSEPTEPTESEDAAQPAADDDEPAQAETDPVSTVETESAATDRADEAQGMDDDIEIGGSDTPGDEPSDAEDPRDDTVETDGTDAGAIVEDIVEDTSVNDSADAGETTDAGQTQDKPEGDSADSDDDSPDSTDQA